MTEQSRATRPGKRFASLFLALLQLGVLIAAPVADAQLEAQQVGHAAHLGAEDGSGTYHHDHLTCQFCRTLDSGRHLLEGFPSTVRFGHTLATSTLDVGRSVDPSAAGRSGSVGPRAPPSA